MLVLIWVLTVCKGYRQTIKLAASKERVSKGKILSGAEDFFQGFEEINALFLESKGAQTPGGPS